MQRFLKLSCSAPSCDRSFFLLRQASYCDDSRVLNLITQVLNMLPVKVHVYCSISYGYIVKVSNLLVFVLFSVFHVWYFLTECNREPVSNNANSQFHHHFL